MSDYTPQTGNQESNGAKNNSGEEIKVAGQSLLTFLKEFFDLRGNVNKSETKEEIKQNISFKGLQAYVLVASIVMASIGLNANSTAVVIGAMLISPLMGPIVGFGYSVAVNDLETLRRSLLNFALMVIIAMVTSFLYFKLIPISTITDELRARIEPTVLDVLIAIAGGFAGIIAASSHNKNVNVVAGVAIGTALMPPLCTAGFGLSKWGQIVYDDYHGYEAALNSLYLFFINSTFISITTFIFVRFMRFPLAKFQNSKRRRRTNVVITITALIVMIPSTWLFYRLINENQKKYRLNNFLQEIQTEVQSAGAFIDNSNPVITSTDSTEVINLSATGNTISYDLINNWNSRLKQIKGFGNSVLIVHQGVDATQLKEEMGNTILKDLYQDNQQKLLEKDSIIASLQNKVARLSSDSIPFQDISRQVKAIQPEIKTFGYSTFQLTDFKRREIFPTFVVTYKSDSVQDRAKKLKQINNFLKASLKLDTLKIIEKY